MDVESNKAESEPESLLTNSIEQGTQPSSNTGSSSPCGEDEADEGWITVKKKTRCKLKRSRPTGVKGQYRLCNDYQHGRPCARRPCQLAHGEKERQRWTEERRKEGLFT